MSESTQMKLSRVRKQRVHIVYEVETEGAEEVKELPFVVGVLGDFSGDPTEPLKPLRDRKFIQIDRDNFNEILQRLTPGVNVRVKNTLAGDSENGAGSELGVQLKFNSIDDFEPGKIVEQVEPLKKLLDARNRLRDLLTKVDRSEDLEIILEGVLQNEDQMQELTTAVEAEAGADSTDADTSQGEETSPGPEGGEE